MVLGSATIECRSLEQQRQIEESTKCLLRSQVSPVSAQQGGRDGLIIGGTTREGWPVEHPREIEKSMISLLQSQVRQQQGRQDGPSSEQISDLTVSINRFIDALEEGKNSMQEKGRKQGNGREDEDK